jgi:hypothetical protein
MLSCCLKIVPWLVRGQAGLNPGHCPTRIRETCPVESQMPGLMGCGTLLPGQQQQGQAEPGAERGRHWTPPGLKRLLLTEILFLPSPHTQNAPPTPVNSSSTGHYFRAVSVS